MDDVPTADDMLVRARARADRAAARSVELYRQVERLRATPAGPPPPLPARRSASARGLDLGSVQSQVAQLEEMAAATHERAAELYESWLKHHTDASLEAPERLAREHREIAGASRSVERLAERTLGGFEARVDSAGGPAGKTRSLLALAALNRLRVLIGRRVDETVETCRRDGATWADIASALHITRQTAHERYHRRTG